MIIWKKCIQWLFKKKEDIFNDYLKKDVFTD